MNIKKGFTLIELLIVMAILGILATIGFGNFLSSRVKAKDVTRKSDLQTIAKSLEAYANDYRAYPSSSATGKIMVAGSNIEWGSAFKDTNTTYISKLPSDPGGYTYFYQKSGTGYYIYAYLENTQDPAITTFTPAVSCGNANCNFRISSSNL